MRFPAALAFADMASAFARMTSALSGATESVSDTGFKATERELIPVRSASEELAEALRRRDVGRGLSKISAPSVSLLDYNCLPTPTCR